MVVELTDQARQCPQCRTGSGMPDRDAPHEQPQLLRVLLRCSQCRHRWSILVPSPADAGKSAVN